MRLNARIQVLGLAFAAIAAPLGHTATLEGTYVFGNTLAAQQGGAPSLTATDPLSQNAFVTDTVFGNSRTVYQFNGNSSDQAGLTLDTTSLLPASSYSIEMVFDFTQNAGGWRRVIDVQNRQSDDGFYVDPSNTLDVFPVVGGTAGAFSLNTFYDVVLTNDGTTVNAYLNGALALTGSTAVMDINNAGNLMNFFLDNTAGGGQGEYSSGEIALIRAYSGILSASDVTNLDADPFAGTGSTTPEPASGIVFGIGILGVLVGRRKLKVA